MTPRTTPLHRVRRHAALLATSALLVGGTAVAGPAVGEDVPPPVAVEVLSAHADFPDAVGVTIHRRLPGERRDVIRLRDAGNVVVARLTVQPGARFPWHTHPGPVVVSVVGGDLVYQQATDCVQRRYATSEAFVDPGDKIHTAWNPGDEPTVLVATFYGVPDGGAVTLPVQDPPDYCSGKDVRPGRSGWAAPARLVAGVPGRFAMA
ncbi:quercetin dioxygenase-like cupin family protein [Isoptericola jiangsuensis]|uniref:Quercetin dioxygenase-like cupin family protein n=1 Tax=Isoptericola jiangsuensis TaxID=548579 RepID=A0A2A9ESP3_9MICO|nr:cupin domain-containing protein [Isoptericola jiangsuensis]PFG41551.1 quercetin dioxygenase-like cupin family protein [Isoptericola jiangsuensis]